MARTRSEFQVLADLRAAEADALLARGMWDGAYYLAGYAVECALKARVARLTAADEFPPHHDVVRREYYIHDLGQLVRTARLDADRLAEVGRNPTFGQNWGVVTRWKEDSRYDRKTETQARELCEAVTDPTTGVLPWIKRYW